MNKLENKNITEELSSVMNYITNSLLKEYPSNKITPEYFLLSILCNEDCIAYQTINKIMFNETIEMLKSWYYQYISRNTSQITNNEQPITDNLLQVAFKTAEEQSDGKAINSANILYSLLETDDIVKNSFRLLGVTEEQVKENIVTIKDETIINEKEENDGNKELAVVKTVDNKLEKYKHNKQKEKNNDNTHPSQKIKTFVMQKTKPKLSSNEVEKNLINLNVLASEGRVDEVFENDDIIFDIFTNLQKRYKNNVIVIGESGCGKTSTVKHIANMIINENVPKQFLKKKLVQLDFSSLLTGTGFRGSFENKFNNIVNDAKKDGNYIFFIDDIQSILNDKSKFGEVDIETMLDTILMEKNIQFICTASNKGYKNCIENNQSFKRRFQKITMDTPSIEKSFRIVNSIKYKIENYHNVKYSDKVVEDCVKLCKRYITDNVLPDSAINVLDKIGAKISLTQKDDIKVNELKNKLKLNDIEKQKVNELTYKDYDRYDELVRKEIQLKTQLSIIEKEQNLNKAAYEVSNDDLREAISEVSGVSIQNLSINDIDRLKGINERIKECVIGQDEAVDTVCNSIKKQKLGISNPDKPSVFLFTGSTGTGKTFLAKKIAKEVFGDDKYLVRLDMSEYSDKMSVNKLYGAASGYVGYDNGGILTEAIKKNKHCVLLLDEIEKANEEVHNVFLQLFDDGRLTDNTGCVVDFKNVIIIMTSNVGAKEVDEKGDGIGFNKNMTDNNENIIKKSIKRKFKPEFINRINKIIYFNKLSNNSLKDIVKLELQNFEKRLNNADYYLEDNFIDNDMIDKIYNKIDGNKYGARTIIRQIETDVEDVVTEYILNNNVSKNHIFTKKELYN